MKNLMFSKVSMSLSALVLLAVFGLAGCGGGGDGGGSGSTADTTRPTVSSINPANGSTNVPLNTGISAVFSEAMDYLTVTNATFTVSNSVGNISGAVSCSGTTAAFTPSANLGDNTTYTATITTAAKDSSGNALATNYSWTFTTGVAPDTTPPTVSSTSPASNATGVAVNSGITAAFSENMDSSTITTATFTLQQGASPVSGTVTYSGTTATFTPSANLGYNTTYTATITTAAKDSSGNALATNYTWSFTTGVAPDNTAPTNTTASNFINGGATVTALNSMSLSISATDDVGVSAYYASESSTAPLASDSGWTAITAATSYSANVSYSPSSSGGATKTVYVWFKDASGNISASASDSITVIVGGTIQGTPLNLTSTNATVTTFAGAAGLTGSTDATGTAARFNTPCGATTDGTSLFITDGSNHTIRKIVISTGAVTTIAGSAGLTGSTDGTGTSARFNGPADITTDGTNLFVSDTDNNTIRKVVISTGAVSTIAGSAGLAGSIDGTGTASRFYAPRGITTDGTNLFVADRGNHTIRKIVISTGAVSTIAGSAGLTGSTDATGTAARFNLPHGITTDGTSLFVADLSNHTIRKVVISTGVVTTVAGSAGLVGSTDGTGSTARFNQPGGLTTDGTNLYVSDCWNHIIRKIVLSTGAVSTIAGSAGLNGTTDGTGSVAKFYMPVGITTDGTNLFVCDYWNYTIRKIQPTLLIGGAVQGVPLNLTNTVTTFAGSAGLAGSTDATGAAARFNGPFGLTTDGVNLYVADSGNRTIRKIVISTGVVSTIAGTPGVIGSTDGIGAAASFSATGGMTTDGTNLFLGDNLTIRKIVIATGAVTTIAGTPGVGGSTDGTGAAARFNDTCGITTDGTNLFIADRLNYTIRKVVVATGAVTTLAGSAGIVGSTDGTGTTARFSLPHSITTDGTNLYVTDNGNNTIRKIVISTGVVTTLAGTAGTTGSTDGTGAAARFNSPVGITTDGSNLFVTQWSGQTIRKIVISTGVVSTVAGSPGISGSSDGTGSAARFYWPQNISTDGVNLFIADSGNHTIRKIQ